MKANSIRVIIKRFDLKQVNFAKSLYHLIYFAILATEVTFNGRTSLHF